MFNILLISSIFGFVLTTLLFFKKSTQPKATFFLGCFYFLLSVYALQAFIIDGGYLEYAPWFFLWPLIPYNLFAVPIYFYFITVLEDRFRWKNSYLLLFLPCAIGVVDVGYVYLQPDAVYDGLRLQATTDPKSRMHAGYWLLNLDQHMFMRHVWQFAALMIVLPRVMRFMRTEASARLKMILNRWLLVFWFILTLFALSATLYALLNMLGISIFDKSALVPIVLYLIMTFIGVIPIYFPTILHGYPQAIKEGSGSNEISGQELDNRFGLDAREIEHKLELLVREEFHLQQDFNLTNLARELEMPAHHLSYFIKQHFGLSFTSYKNHLRMERAKKLIKEGFLETNTMEALAWECGFASRSSFSKAFKNTMALNPSEYALQHR